MSSEFKVIDQKVVRVIGAFIQASAPNGIDWRQDSFSIYIASVVSPRSTAPTLSFKAFIRTSGGFVQYKKE